MTELLHEGLDARAISERLLRGLGVADTTFTMAPSYGPCEKQALQTRMKRAVALLGADEIENLLEEEGKIEVCSPPPNDVDAINDNSLHSVQAEVRCFM